MTKRAENRPLSGRFQPAFLPAFSSPKGKTRGFWPGRCQKGVPEHEESGSSRSRIPSPNKTESISWKAVKNPLFTSRKAPSGPLWGPSAGSGSCLGNMGLFWPERAGSDRAGKSRLFPPQENSNKAGFRRLVVPVGRGRSVFRKTHRSRLRRPQIQHRSGAERAACRPVR